MNLITRHITRSTKYTCAAFHKIVAHGITITVYAKTVAFGRACHVYEPVRSNAQQTLSQGPWHVASAT